MAITATFISDFTNFLTGARDAEAALGGVEAKSADVATGLDNTAKSMGVNYQALAQNLGSSLRAVGQDVSATAGAFIASYAQEQTAVNNLVTALGAQGLATTENVAAYQAMATQFQNTTKYSDDAIMSTQALLTQVGKVAPEQMHAATTAATNLASALGISLESATMMVAKAFGTGGESLGKLKALLGDSVDKGADMATVLTAINEQFGPAAVAEMDTYAGQTARLGNQFDDFKEKIGGLIVNALTPLMNAFAAMPEGLQTVIVGFVALGTALAPLALSMGGLVTALTPLAPMLAGLLPFLGPGALIAAGAIAVYLAFKNWDAIVGYVAAVYNAIKTYLVDRFNALIGSIMAPIDAVANKFKWLYNVTVGHSYIPDMINGIQTEFARLDAVMVQPAAAAASAVAASMKTASAFGMTPGMQGVQVPTSLSRFDLYGRAAISPFLSGMATDYTPPITITINGSVLGNKDEIARVVGDAVTSSYRTGGNRLPA